MEETSNIVDAANEFLKELGKNINPKNITRTNLKNILKEAGDIFFCKIKDIEKNKEKLTIEKIRTEFSLQKKGKKSNHETRGKFVSELNERISKETRNLKCKLNKAMDELIILKASIKKGNEKKYGATKLADKAINTQDYCKENKGLVNLDEILNNESAFKKENSEKLHLIKNQMKDFKSEIKEIQESISQLGINNKEIIGQLNVAIEKMKMPKKKLILDKYMNNNCVEGDIIKEIVSEWYKFEDKLNELRHEVETKDKLLKKNLEEYRTLYDNNSNIERNIKEIFAILKGKQPTTKIILEVVKVIKSSVEDLLLAKDSSTIKSMITNNETIIEQTKIDLDENNNDELLCKVCELYDKIEIIDKDNSKLKEINAKLLEENTGCKSTMGTLNKTILEVIKLMRITPKRTKNLSELCIILKTEVLNRIRMKHF